MENMKQMMPMMTVMMIIVITSIVFTWQGIAMHNKIPTEEANFHSLQTNYFTINKAERDSAPTGSELNNQLAQIHNYPSTLLELKLVGVGKILTGIFFLLFGILIALIIMPVRLGRMIKGMQEHHH